MAIYGRAPITEAVIELGFASSLAIRTMERVRDRLKSRYAISKDRTNVDIRVDIGRGAGIRETPAGYQLDAENGIDAAIIQPGSLSTNRRAPYNGWVEFMRTAQLNFSDVVKIAGKIHVNRASTRFINRIDIPDEMVMNQDINQFFHVGPSLPDCTMNRFSLNAEFIEPKTGLTTVVNFSSVPPVLFRHQSFVLDFDVKMADLPNIHKEETLWEKVEILQTAKNNLFESAITDKVRELIA